MALALGKLILAGANATTNTAGAYFQTVTVAAVNTGTVVPAGLYIACPQANTAYQANNGSSIVTVLPANVGGVIFSDGINVFANASTNATVTLITVNGGELANGTYNK
jgi:hypothetical protein